MRNRRSYGVGKSVLGVSRGACVRSFDGSRFLIARLGKWVGGPLGTRERVVNLLEERW